jgi:hypothetical protein
MRDVIRLVGNGKEFLVRVAEVKYVECSASQRKFFFNLGGCCLVGEAKSGAFDVTKAGIERMLAQPLEQGFGGVAFQELNFVMLPLVVMSAGGGPANGQLIMPGGRG